MRLLIIVCLLVLVVPCASYAVEGGVTPPTLPAPGKPGSFGLSTASDQMGELEDLFSADWQEFTDSMTSTPLFSTVVQGMTFDDSGADPVMHFDFGNYGEQDIDFSDWPEDVFLIIRALILCTATWYGINIALRG
jgi:hypothetical protein